jgi:hypothetical protein
MEVIGCDPGSAKSTATILHKLFKDALPLHDTAGNRSGHIVRSNGEFQSRRKWTQNIAVKFPGGGACHDIGLKNWEKRDEEETEAWGLLGSASSSYKYLIYQHPVGNLMLGAVLTLSVDLS